MPSFKRRVFSMLPQPLIRQLNTSRAIAEDRRLTALRVNLSDRHIRNVRVVAGRGALLDQMPKGGAVAEVGVADGEFSAEILRCCQPAVLHLIDWWDAAIPEYGPQGLQTVQERFQAEIEAGQVMLHRGLSWDMLGQLDDGCLDWVFLDASFTFDNLSRDLSEAHRKVKPGGFIVGRSYMMWAGPDSRYGTVEAVNKFCVEQGYEFAFLGIQGAMHLSYALRQIEES